MIDVKYMMKKLLVYKCCTSVVYARLNGILFIQKYWDWSDSHMNEIWSCGMSESLIEDFVQPDSEFQRTVHEV